MNHNDKDPPDLFRPRKTNAMETPTDFIPHIPHMNPPTLLQTTEKDFIKVERVSFPSGDLTKVLLAKNTILQAEEVVTYVKGTKVLCCNITLRLAPDIVSSLMVLGSIMDLYNQIILSLSPEKSEFKTNPIDKFSGKSFADLTQLRFLRELNNLLEGCETSITQPDDPSGLCTQYTLDTEAFRDKLQKRIDELS